MPSSLGYSAPVLYGALVKAPPIFQRTELSLKFVWLFLFFVVFLISVFSLIWPVNPGFYVWAYDSLQVSALLK